MIRQAAFTLIEVLVTVVVIGIAAVSLTSVYTNMISGSADPMIQQQATAIAEAYLEEISLRAFENPDPGVAETGTDEGEPGRSAYDDVQDYRSLAAGPAADQSGTPIPSLAAYTVTVTITNTALDSVPAADALRIEVSVNHPAIDPVSVAGFRSKY